MQLLVQVMVCDEGKLIGKDQIVQIPVPSSTKIKIRKSRITIAIHVVCMC